MITLSFLRYYQCEKLNKEEMKLFCMECDEFVCSLGFNHPKHDIIQVTQFVDKVKNEWINNINNAFKIDDSKEISIEKEIGDVYDEIKQLEEKLNQLAQKN